MTAESVWAGMTSWLTPSMLFVVVNLTIGTIAVISSFAAPRKQHHQQPPPHQLVRSPSLLERVRSFNFSLYKYDQLDPPQPAESLYRHMDRAEPEPPAPQPVRIPSLLDRVKSNLSLYGFEQAHPTPPETVIQPADAADAHSPSPQLARVPSLLDRVRFSNFSLYRNESPEVELESTDPSEEFSDQNPITESDTARKSGDGARSLLEKMKKSASLNQRRSRFEAEDGEEDVDRRRPETMREGKGRGGAASGEEEGVDARADDFINRFKQQLKLQRLDSLLRYKEVLNRGSSK